MGDPEAAASLPQVAAEGTPPAAAAAACQGRGSHHLEIYRTSMTQYNLPQFRDRFYLHCESCHNLKRRVAIQTLSQ